MVCALNAVSGNQASRRLVSSRRLLKKFRKGLFSVITVSQCLYLFIRTNEKRKEKRRKTKLKLVKNTRANQEHFKAELKQTFTITMTKYLLKKD